ncbi:hypothetical protein AAFF_G00168710 [Aldrovandia affinis]|uniref:C2H2-type domain-containing protein n=1 Tax=Aldrovandia affinis TaxID=143900 RepID=A0AAD7R0F4_9TELE|nr:hypothetical protein AAFF_G00168710 [Aldrovandia affinis]
MHNLMGHMHLHSDSKPFKCLYCPSKFTLKGNLTRHMKVKHGIMDRGRDARALRWRARLHLSARLGIGSCFGQKEPFDPPVSVRQGKHSEQLVLGRGQGLHLQGQPVQPCTPSNPRSCSTVSAAHVTPTQWRTWTEMGKRKMSHRE